MNTLVYTALGAANTSTTPDKDQLSLTNPRDALHHAERAANK